MAIQFWNDSGTNKILFDSTSIAMSSDCCCEEGVETTCCTDSLPNDINVDASAVSVERNPGYTTCDPELNCDDLFGSYVLSYTGTVSTPTYNTYTWYYEGERTGCDGPYSAIWRRWPALTLTLYCHKNTDEHHWTLRIDTYNGTCAIGYISDTLENGACQDDFSDGGLVLSTTGEYCVNNSEILCLFDSWPSTITISL